MLIVSSQFIYVHKFNFRDSKAVVTPFMQDGTYPSRSFATLGPSELRPPFTGTYKNNYNFFSFYSTGQVSDFIQLFKICKILCF